MQHLHQQSRVQTQRIQRIRVKIDCELEERVDDGLHNDLCATLKENEIVKEKYPSNFFPRIFWEQQQKASQLKSANSMYAFCPHIKPGWPLHPYLMPSCSLLASISCRALPCLACCCPYEGASAPPFFLAFTRL